MESSSTHSEEAEAPVVEVELTDLLLGEQVDETADEVTVKESKRRYQWSWKVLLCCVIASLPTLVAGITISIPSTVILDLEETEMDLPPDFQLSTTDKSLFAGLALAGAVFGAPVSGWSADRWGRKFSLMFSCAPCVIGYLMISYAHLTSSASTFRGLLQTGRFFSGISMGWSSTAFAVYIGEISSSKLRGLFGILLTGSTMVGVTLSFALGSIDGFFYHQISLVAVGIVAVFEVLMFWLPETPRSLLSRGYMKEARRVLQWLRGPEFEKEFEEIKQLIIESRKYKKQPWRRMLRKSALVPFLYTAIVLSVKTFCGFHAVTAFAGQIFVSAGIDNPRTTVTYSTGTANLFGVVVALLVVDRLGRKPLLIFGGLFAAVGSIMLGAFFYVTRSYRCGNDTAIGVSDSGSGGSDDGEACSEPLRALAIVGLIIYNFGYSIGFGPLPWVLASEFIPLTVRGKAVGTLTFYFFGCSTLMMGLYLYFVELVTVWFAMWSFAVVSLAGSVFALVLIPETRGQSLEAVERTFQEKHCSLHIYCIKK